MRMVISTNVVPPYRISLFEAMAREGGLRGWELIILAWSAEMGTRGWTVRPGEVSFPLITLGGQMGMDGRVGKSLALSLLPVLSRLKPDVVLTTGFGLETAVALADSVRRRRCGLVWSEAIGGSGDYDDSNLRIAQRRLLLRMARGIVAPGVRAEEYARTVLHKPVLRLRNTVDSTIFRPAQGITSGRTIISVGQLQPYRNWVEVLPAIAGSIRTGLFDKWVLVGDGPLRTNICSKAFSLLGEGFEYHRAEDTSGIARLLQSASCYLSVPSRDIWGFAVQEALMTGLPAVVSGAVGCVADLGVPEENVYVIGSPPNCATFVQEVSAGLRWAGHRDRLRTCRAVAQQLRLSWTPTVSASTFWDSLLARGSCQFQDDQRA